MTYLFLACDSGACQADPIQLPVSYRAQLWMPHWRSVSPHGFPALPFTLWWLMDRLRVFSNRDYAIYVVTCGDQIVHRSCVFPRWFRFPFMRASDLQVGDTWTHPDHRGNGLASHALSAILHHCARPDRRFWYVVAKDNTPSLCVARKAGMQVAGEGCRQKRLGIGALGCYVIRARTQPAERRAVTERLEGL